MLAASEDRKSEFVMTQRARCDRGDHAGGVLDGGQGDAAGPQGRSGPARLVELHGDATRRRVTLVRCLKSVTWPSPRCGLTIFVRIAAPSAREENDARENAKLASAIS